MPQSHEDQHEVVARYVAEHEALPKTRAKTMTVRKRARVEASKRVHNAIKWHLHGPFHRKSWPPLATTEELFALHERLHEKDGEQ